MNLQKNSLPLLTKSTHIVNVPLGKRSYPIYIGSNVLKHSGKYFSHHHVGTSIVVITDENVARHHLSIVQKSLRSRKYHVRSIILPAGEQQKMLGSVEKIVRQLLEWNVERSSTIVALGGGVIGDLAGFVAATYQRGIGFVQIPTTLLAQVDSSVGGKVGVNHLLAKNMIGAFYQPLFVLADTSVLQTLPKRELISGMGEVVKYGIILDRKLFDFTDNNLEKALSGQQTILSNLVRRSCELKSYVVAKDEKESHLRAILNFGHTVGHALEHSGRYGYLKHGEAILYGMVAETHIACEMEMISLKEKERIESLIQRIPLPSLTPLKLKYDGLIATMKKDKKVKDGSIRMTLPRKIGKVTLPMSVTEQNVHHSIDYLKMYGS